MIPGGLVSKVLGVSMNYRDSMYYALTRRKIQRRGGSAYGVDHQGSVRGKLKDEVMKLAKHLSGLNPEARVPPSRQ